MKKILLSAFADEYSQDFERQLAVLKEYNLSMIELRFLDGKNVSDLSEEEARAYKKRLDEAGITVSALGSPLGKISLDDDFAPHLAKTEHTCVLANIFETENIRIFSFYLPKGRSRSDCYLAVRDRLSQMVEIADRYGVRLCHENEAGIWGETPECCLDLILAFDRRIGCVFDMGNFLLDGVDPLHAYALLKPFITYFHIKDALGAGAIVPAGKGEAEIGKILAHFAADEDGNDNPIIATIEPHLETFDGLNALVLPGKSFDNPCKFNSKEDAFTAGVKHTKALIMKEFKKDKLTVKALPTREEMGKVAAADIHDCILSLLAEKESINMIFAAAPSQNDVLQSLIAYPDIDWTRIHAFHMDEYIGLRADQGDKSFGTYLCDHIFGKVPFASVDLIDSHAGDGEAECLRYAKLLRDNPTDIVVMGIGENGHIAFNDPWIAKFDDEQAVKVVPLDEVCRQQQVNDGCFPAIGEVPTHAISLTCPTLAAGKHLFCIVPAKTKAQAVKRTLEGEINEDCPATILRRHESAVLYLDGDSASLL